MVTQTELQQQMALKRSQEQATWRGLQSAAGNAAAKNPELAQIFPAILGEFQKEYISTGKDFATRDVSRMNPENIRQRILTTYGEKGEKAWQAMQSTGAQLQQQAGGGLSSMNFGNWAGLGIGGILGFMLMGGFKGGSIMTPLMAAAVGALALSWVGGKTQTWIAGPSTSPSSTTPTVVTMTPGQQQTVAGAQTLPSKAEEVSRAEPLTPSPLPKLVTTAGSGGRPGVGTRGQA